MATFRNISDADRTVGRSGGPPVKIGETTIVDGVEVTEETDDAYITGEGEQAMAWPKATWELVGTATKKKESD